MEDSFITVACEQALWGGPATGREKERELATMSLEFEFYLQFPCCSPSTEQSDFCPISMFVNVFVFDVITNVISTNQHFASTFLMQIFKIARCTAVVASSPSFSRPTARAPWSACSQTIITVKTIP